MQSFGSQSGYDSEAPGSATTVAETMAAEEVEWLGEWCTDDVSGETLDVGMVKAAREEETTFLKLKRIYDKVPINEAWEITGRGPIGTRWGLTGRRWGHP